MDNPTVTLPTRQGFLRRVFGWSTARKLLFVLAALITLAALFFAEEHWRGSRAWQNYKRDMEAKGEHFDMARLIPPKVPDDQNFAATPYLTGSLQRRTNIWGLVPDSLNPPRRLTWPYGLATDLISRAAAYQATNPGRPAVEIADPGQAASIILDNLKVCQPTLTELLSASTRPYSRFNIPYEDIANPNAMSVTMDQLAAIKGVYSVFSLHAECELVLAQNDLALKDLKVMFRIDDGLRDEPLLISQLVRMAGVTIMLQSIGEGLAEHRWSGEQLQVLQDRLQKTDLLASTAQAFYGERDLCFNPKFDQGYMSPRGWNDLEQLNVNRAFQQTVLPRIDLAARVINPSVNHSMDLVFQASYETNTFSAFIHHRMMAALMLPAYSHVAEKAALAQSKVDMAMVACALERCRLAQNQYPETLSALIPGFATALPHDIINGEPLKYHRLENGRFILYSVGWNEKDDGGVVVATKGTTPHQDIEQGDWIWQYPEQP